MRYRVSYRAFYSHHEVTEKVDHEVYDLPAKLHELAKILELKPIPRHGKLKIDVERLD